MTFPHSRGLPHLALPSGLRSRCVSRLMISSRRLLLFCCLVTPLFMACDDDDPSRQVRPSQAQEFPVRRYDGALPDTPEARDAEERALRERLLSSLSDARQRAVVAEALEDPGSVITSIEDNEEAAELLSKLYALRDARGQERRLAFGRDVASRYPAKATLRLVETMEGDAVTAIVERSAGARSENRVVLQASRLTEAHLLRALATLAASRLTHGEFPPDAIRVYLRETTDSPPVSEADRAYAREVIARLRDAQPVRSEGVLVKEITIEVGPARAVPRPR